MTNDNQNTPLTWWEHFLYLEELLLSSERYVAFIEDNFKTTSITFMHIILAACADIECILKTVLKLNAKDGIKQITSKIIKEHKEFFTIKIEFLPLNCEKEPWSLSNNNNGKNHPLWWDSYNSIKHNKNNYPYRGACLEHTIDALAGLCSVNLAYYAYIRGRNFSEKIKLPKLFDYPGLGADTMLLESAHNISVPGFNY